MKVIQATEGQLNSLLNQWWVEMTVKAQGRGRTVRDDKIAGRMANGQDHPTISTGRVATVTVDPVQGAWIPHPDEQPHWPQDLRDALTALVLPPHTIVDNFIPTPEEEI